MSSDKTVVTISDCIEMTRIMVSSSSDHRVVTFSPDGSKFATVVYRGDLKRNINLYSLLVFDTGQRRRANPEPIATIEFEDDPWDQLASPIERMTFQGDNRSIVFIGRFKGEPAQVYRIDVGNGALQKLTDHPHRVRNYALGPDGNLVMFAAEFPFDPELKRRLERDGFWAADARVGGAGTGKPGRLAAGLLGHESGVEFFLVPPDGEPNRLYRVDRDVNATLVASPTGKHCIVWPYPSGEVGGPSPYGVVDLQTGSVEALADLAYEAVWSGGPLWSPDGASVVLPALDIADDGNATQKFVEADVNSKEVTSIDLDLRWGLVSWDHFNDRLILQRDRGFWRGAGAIGTISKRGHRWGSPEVVGEPSTLNSRYLIGTDAEVAVGVKDGLLTPPDLAVVDLATGDTTVVTDLNPQLEHRRYGEVEKIYWDGPDESKSFGYLVRPVDYQEGRQYPLALLIKDEGADPSDDSFLIDGQAQLSGLAIQPFAAAGIMVLFTPFPNLAKVYGTPDEPRHVARHLETAIDHLENLGMIDPARVAISGWSRAGYYVNEAIMISDHRFAAAAQIDGGFREYLDGMRPFTREELSRIDTPLLVETHGGAVLSFGAIYLDELEALGKPFDHLHFPLASHSTRTPGNRMKSLQAHADWLRFWLQDDEDPDPAKQKQYARWRTMRL